MKVIKRYIEMMAWPYNCIEAHISRSLKVSITIPMRNEKDPILVLKSIYKSNVDHAYYEIIIVLNQDQNTSKEIQKTNLRAFQILNDFKGYNNYNNLHIIFIKDLPLKKSGVGLARKIAMDESLRRFESINKPNGLIVGLDADCVVDSFYVEKLIHLSNGAEGQMGYGFGFEHDQDLIPENTTAIVLYELHLRLYRHALLWAGHPHSQYTIGSALACTALGYAAQGGMNSRKAGEDFYFLQKFIKSGHFEFVPDIKVIPSSRISNRVPFGTGKAIIDYHKTGIQVTYNLKSYVIISEFINNVNQWYQSGGKLIVPAQIIDFWEGDHLDMRLGEIMNETSEETSFMKRFFAWFDAFQAMKLLHYLRDEQECISLNIVDVALEFLHLIEDKLIEKSIEYNKKEVSENLYSLLDFFQKIDQKKIIFF